jgi:hypothetical protein
VSIQEQPDSAAEKPAAQQNNPAPLMAAGASRRRFAKAGLGVSGVILTLVSQPGMAQSVCASPSGSLSGGLQSHAPAVVCKGLSPGYWKSNFPAQPQGLATPLTFGSIFPCDKFHADYAKTSLEAMLSHQDFDKNNVGMHLVAAYLNVQHGKSSFLTVPALQTIWSEYQSSGAYRPTATVSWSGFDIVVYLSGTMA